MLHKTERILIPICIILMLLIVSCTVTESPAIYPVVDREDKLPVDIAKREPETDHHPPILHSDEYESPVRMPDPINTAGGEDSPFILPDGNTIYFFFTPDVRVPAEKQLLDGVTGIYVSSKTGDGGWSKPQRVWLERPHKLSLEGAVCIQGDEMWFCSVREGYSGVNMFTAELVDGEWVEWKYAGDRLMKELEIGEVHRHGDDLYFHSGRSGGKGGYDIWVTTRDDDSWSDPVNIEAVNTDSMEGWPYISADGNELWFTRVFGAPEIYRSVKTNGVWGEPELIVSQFAGEPTLDDDGNLYFVHHYFENDVMIEADIYVAYRKK